MSARQAGLQSARGGGGADFSVATSYPPLALTSLQSVPNMAALTRSTLDRPNHLALSHCREAGWRRYGCGLQG